MKALVFGKTGQVARSLATRLRSPESTLFLDRGQADLSSPDTARRAIEAFEPDIVINAAAYTAVDQAESEPQAARVVNADAPGVMAEACAESGAWLIQYSTDYVFDGTAAEPYTEDARVAPLNVYGRTKLAGEEAVRDILERHLIFRTSWVYSNHGHNFLNTMLRLSNERERLAIVSDQTGAPTWAGAIAAATDQVVHSLAIQASGADDKAGTYHMSCAGHTSWYGFARAIFEHTGRLDRIRVEPIDTRDYPTAAERPMFSVLSNEKLERVFGVKLADWDDALQQCLSERDHGEQ